jgi:hypothetical protein
MQLDLISAHDGSKRITKINNAPLTNNLLNAGLFNLVSADKYLIIPASWSKL